MQLEMNSWDPQLLSLRKAEGPRCRSAWALRARPVKLAHLHANLRIRALFMHRVLTFVLATPISGPALICTPQSVSREMELPTVLVMPTVRAPLSLQYRRAIKVSAVSPAERDGPGQSRR